MSEPDWIYGETGGGTYSIDGFIDDIEFHSSPIPFDRLLDDPGVFYVGSAVMPMESGLARRGVRGIHQQITPDAQVIASVKLRRGPLGWLARRWIDRHPLQLTAKVYRPEWGEWRSQVGEVRVDR